MEWLFDNNAPIYSQLIDRIKLGIVSGELPPGLSLSSGGVISGVPADIGSWQFTVRASNGVGSPDTQTLEITVEERELFYTPLATAFS